MSNRVRRLAVALRCARCGMYVRTCVRIMHRGWYLAGSDSHGQNMGLKGHTCWCCCKLPIVCSRRHEPSVSAFQEMNRRCSGNSGVVPVYGAGRHPYMQCIFVRDLIPIIAYDFVSLTNVRKIVRRVHGGTHLGTETNP